MLEIYTLQAQIKSLQDKLRKQIHWSHIFHYQINLI
jgi:hypothetical protein